MQTSRAFAHPKSDAHNTGLWRCGLNRVDALDETVSTLQLDPYLQQAGDHNIFLFYLSWAAARGRRSAYDALYGLAPA